MGGLVHTGHQDPVAEGVEHPDYVDSLASLAQLLQDDGGFHDETLPMLEHVMQFRVKTYGERHNENLTAMNNLAACYHYLGRGEEALRMRERVLKLSVEVRG